MDRLARLSPPLSSLTRTTSVIGSARRCSVAVPADTRRISLFSLSRRPRCASSLSGERKREGSKAQKSAYDHYRRQREDSFWSKLFSPFKKSKAGGGTALSLSQRNVNLAWYMLAVAVGTVGATYASAPLYKVFCQTTGFGGTTQRVLVNAKDAGVIETMLISAWNALPESVRDALGAAERSVGPASGVRVHTWTDEDAAARLADLRPVENAELIKVHFDSTVSSVLPWSFEPVQDDVRVVPGETALAFFRVTNHSDVPITGVATYNVNPPKAGLYFQKIQCFCFEEQRLLPGETVDMPVFFFIDPDFLKDGHISYVRHLTLGYTFFRTDQEDDDDDEDEDEEEEVKKGAA